MPLSKIMQLPKLLILFVLLLLARPTFSQELSTENGWFQSPYGRLHILIVYAEIKFDSIWGNLDPQKNPEGSIGWKVGKLPGWKQWCVSKDPNENGWMTKYFRQASFGKFQVTGDVLDSIMTIPISSIRDEKGNVVTQEAYAQNHYRKAVLNKVNSLQNPPFLFGSKVADFDRWTYTGGGKPNVEEPNGKLDLIMIVWRNIHVGGLGEASGFVMPGDIGEVLGHHTDMYSMFRTESMLPEVIMRHEFSHTLYGGNNFHTAGGGVGQRTFMQTVGGWSNMSAADGCSPIYNAWDRERLNWRNPDNTFLISARCNGTDNEVNGDLEYGDELCSFGEFTLRDFATTGDAIKIKLPHLPDKVRNQYLWLENHQRVDGMIDHEKSMSKGLYAYIQVGKDKRKGRTIYDGPNNYIWPLVAQGSYDFVYLPEQKAIDLREGRANPLTGANYLMRFMHDTDGDGKFRITGEMGQRTEWILPEKLFVEGEEKGTEFFSYMQYPLFGTPEVAFRPNLNSKMGLGYNPSCTPLYSHSGQQPMPDDNRRIYLNGLSVEVISQNDDGSVGIRIRWDDFDIPNNVRWCGDVSLSEKAHVKKGGSITLDQGFTPQVAQVVQTLKGEKLFTEPTLLEVDSGATLMLDKYTNLWIKNGATLLIRKGANVILADRSGIVVEQGSHLFIEEGATLKVGKKESGIVWKGSMKIMSVNPSFAKRIEGLKPAKV
jgi:M6 family metalloprotease-like protein